MSNIKHPSHETRISDASSYDEVCIHCGATDGMGTWDKLALPCPIKEFNDIWPNGCNKTSVEALRYLAHYDRPHGGEQQYNAAHLYQIADELEEAIDAIKEVIMLNMELDAYKNEIYNLRRIIREVNQKTMEKNNG